VTDSQLAAAILADAPAKALADAGNDAGCALAIASTLPPTTIARFADGSTILSAFGDPTAGYAAIQAIQAAAQSNPALAYILPWLSPGAPGINIGDPATVAMIGALEAAGVLTSAQAWTILAIAHVPATIDPGQVSRAWQTYRPGGLVGGNS
jgi:hypothetical protein